MGNQQTNLTHGHNLLDQNGGSDSSEANQVLPRKVDLGPVEETQDRSARWVSQVGTGEGASVSGIFDLCPVACTQLLTSWKILQWCLSVARADQA